jgi:hypothetical protein
MDVTGTKTIGDATAKGKVTLSNPTGKKVTLDAGSVLQDKITGTQFATVDKVDVPTGKNGAPGFKDADVVSLVPGTVGNRDVGLLSGKLDNGLYYSNRDTPIAGGTDKQIAVVAQADLDALQALAVTDMTSEATNHAPEGGLIILTSSIQLTQTSFTPDHQLDEPATKVTMTATAQASALAYDPSALRNRVVDALAASAPSGYEVDRTSLRLSDPSPKPGVVGESQLLVHVEGSARALLTATERATIAEKVAGHGETAVRTYLATLPDVEGFEIRYSPGWLPHRIPSSVGRIDVKTR